MQTTRPPSVTHPLARPAAHEAIRLRYTGDAPVIVTGPGTGTLYRIEPEAREIAVDRRDLPALVATGRFARVDI
jgi:hypothetical protein